MRPVPTVTHEPTPSGGLRLIGADYLEFKEVWDANHPLPPQLMPGSLFHLFDAPNQFGLKAFYTLHVWAWKHRSKRRLCRWIACARCNSFVDPKPSP